MTVEQGYRLGLKSLSVPEKLEALRRELYIGGKPTLRGGVGTRLFDALVIRSFGKLFSGGTRQKTPELEYARLTGNLRRLGAIAHFMARFGPPGRWALRSLVSVGASTLVRQGLFGIQHSTDDVVGAAAQYFTAAEALGFEMEITGVSDDRVDFKFLRCPAGYQAGDSVKVCLATNKWDRQCARVLGAKMVMEELIPEGAPACVGHFIPLAQRTPQRWRRYPRGWL